MTPEQLRAEIAQMVAALPDDALMELADILLEMQEAYGSPAPAAPIEE